VASQPGGHEPDHRDLDHGLEAAGQPLVVAGPACGCAPASKRSCHYPTARQHPEALDVIGAPDDLQH